MSSVIVILATLVASLQLVWVNGKPAHVPRKPHVLGKPQVPCLFIFGDSLSDSGNNNDLITGAKCNFPPYGVDFPDGPTGRFTNGRTAIDLIGDHLGLEDYIKPYPKATASVMMKGVNYASGSSGILDETGFQVGDRICMNKQMQRHREIVMKITKRFGRAKANAHLGKCLYSVYAGSNDWMFNYFLRPSVMATNLIPHAYADKLIKTLTTQIDTLLGLGAKKIMVFGMSPLGCLPVLNMVNTCSPVINDILKMYNNKLKTLVKNYNRKGGAHFIYINTMDIFSPNNLQTLVKAGLKITNQPCCGISAECVPFSIPCGNRNERAYWDQEHPTEAANKILAARAYKAQTPTDTYPMDVSALARL